MDCWENQQRHLQQPGRIPQILLPVRRTPRHIRIRELRQKQVRMILRKHFGGKAMAAFLN